MMRDLLIIVIFKGSLTLEKAKNKTILANNDTRLTNLLYFLSLSSPASLNWLKTKKSSLTRDYLSQSSYCSIEGPPAGLLRKFKCSLMLDQLSQGSFKAILNL